MIPDGSIFNVPLASPRAYIVQTEISVTSTSAYLVAENTFRKSLKWMVVGTNQVTCAPGPAPVVYGHGMMYGPGGTGPTQGASEDFPNAVPTNAFQVICNTGLASTVIVWEGF